MLVFTQSEDRRYESRGTGARSSPVAPVRASDSATEEVGAPGRDPPRGESIRMEQTVKRLRLSHPPPKAKTANAAFNRFAVRLCSGQQTLALTKPVGFYGFAPGCPPLESLGPLGDEACVQAQALREAQHARVLNMEILRKAREAYGEQRERVAMAMADKWVMRVQAGQTAGRDIVCRAQAHLRVSAGS